MSIDPDPTASLADRAGASPSEPAATPHEPLSYDGKRGSMDWVETSGVSSRGAVNLDDPLDGLPPADQEKIKAKLTEAFGSYKSKIHRVTDRKLLDEFAKEKAAISTEANKVSRVDLSSMKLYSIDSPEKNGIAFPGVAVISTAEINASEADRKGTLSHEIAHVAMSQMPGHHQNVEQKAEKDIARLMKNTAFQKHHNGLTPSDQEKEMHTARALAYFREEEFEADSLGRKGSGLENMITHRKHAEADPASKDRPDPTGLREFLMDHPTNAARIAALEQNSHSEYVLPPLPTPNSPPKSHSPAVKPKSGRDQ